ncbi:MAG: PQQ-binding-like beta-propeller repeat protein, partial [Bacteroidota bacterium]
MRILLRAGLCLLVGIIAPAAYAQVSEPIAETPLEGNAKKIFLHTSTGIPILQTNSEYLGMNPSDGSILWRTDRNSGAAFSESIDSESETKDFNEIAGTPYVFASGNLIRVTDGSLIIDGTANELKKLRTYYFMPDSDLMLLEIGAKGAIFLYAVDPFVGENKWGVQLREQSGLGQLLNEDNAGQAQNEIQPQVTSQGNLVYPNDKYLAMIDVSTGELKWNEKFNAGYIFTNSDGSRMVIAEKRGGLGGALASGGLGNARKFGKEVYLIDTETGESIWRKKQKMDGNVLYVAPYEDGFMIVHDEGMNIFDYNDSSGDGRWRKDYKENGTVNVEILDEGLMVYTRNKRMLVNPETGEDVWRRPERLEKEPRGFLWGLSNPYETFELAGFTVTDYGRSISLDNGGVRSYSYDHNGYIVEDNRIVLIDYIEPEGNRIGAPPYDIYALELSNGELDQSRERFTLRKGATGFDATTDGYFVYNDRGYVLFDYDGSSGFDERKKEWYPDPTAALRLLGDVASTTAGAAYATTQYGRMVGRYQQGDFVESSQNFSRRMDNLNTVS